MTPLFEQSVAERHMTSHPLGRHHPRRRMIQYPLRWCLEHGGKTTLAHGVTGSPTKSGMTAEGVARLKTKTPLPLNRLAMVGIVCAEIYFFIQAKVQKYGSKCL